MSKVKITELYENRLVTRNQRNEYGQWETIQQELRYKKPINDLSIGLRIVNLLIDFVFYYQILGWVLEQLSIFNNPIIEIVYTFSFPLYYLLSEHLFQRTLGKFFTKSIVINEYGEKVDFKTSVVRTVIRFIPFEAFSFFNGNRGWHDTWTDTYVIGKEELETLLDFAKNPENTVP